MSKVHAHAPFAIAVLAALATSACVGPQEHCSAPAYSGGDQAQAQAAGGLDPNLFVGKWEGRGCQSDGPCWTIRVMLDGDDQGRPTGAIAYPSVPCAAELEFVRWEGDVAAFRERFRDPGRCVPDGWLRLRLIDADHVSFAWSFPDGRLDAGTTLERAQ
jgi:hypothetical protein